MIVAVPKGYMMAIDNELNPVLGIDLGTTFSAIARWDGRGPNHYQMKTGESTLQSVVYCDPSSKEMLVGKLAYRKGLLDPENMVLGIKRKMDDATQQVTAGGCTYSPIDISAKILQRLYADVEQKFPKGRFQSRGTVVTVPYYFKAHQCENTRKAAEQANIECIGIIQEPIAASLSYALQLVNEHPEKEGVENILVFDLGGGTFDLTLFRLERTTKKLLFEVLASDGNDRLGGMDFDECLVKLILEKGHVSLDGLSPTEGRKARQKVLEQAIEAKITLSSTTDTYVSVPDVVPGTHIDTEVSRAEFESSIESYVEKIKDIISRLWIASSLQPSKVDRVIRVGGSSIIPCMKSLLADIIGEEKVYGNINPSLCVAEGAAMYAAYLDDREVLGRDIEIRTRTCHALGVETNGGRFHVLIPPNRKTPSEQRECFTTSADNMTELPINVYQGSSPLVAGNALIGTLTIGNLPPRPKGELDIDVTFKVNEEQKLSVIVEVEGMRKAATLNYS
ncbi:MAG: Hsp70 family protein [Armatimonadota bacterium]